MKFGMTGLNAGPGADPAYAVEVARMLENAGFESIWTVEHVVVPAGYRSQYPYSPSGKMPGGEEIDITDPLVWMAFVAAATERINLATGILILPQRNPVLLAKECATLDRLSRGRLMLGVGVGWLREEFEALGVPFDRRGERTDEYVAAMRALWDEDDPTFDGTYVSFERAKSHPKPSRRVPVIVGGHSDAAARRAARVGDGFFPYSRDFERDAELFSLVRRYATEAGRDPASIELTAMARPTYDNVARYAELGVSRFVTAPLAFDVEGMKRAVDDLVETVIAKLYDQNESSAY